MRYEPLEDVFAALMRSIIYQQLSGKAAATIFGRVAALFDGEPDAEQLGALSDEALRAAGLSGAKTRALRSLAEHILSGACPSVEAISGMPDEEVRERLTQVRGVGVWTVNMLLMFRLARPDVMPSADLGIRKGFAVVMGLEELPAPRELAAATEHWAPWRSVASWYLWRALEVELD